MSNPEYVKSLILTCPAIVNEVGELDLHIDQVGADPVNYSIDSEPTSQLVKRYLSGDQIKRFTFGLSARKKTFTDADRANNSEVYDQVSLWMETQSRMRLLPPMDDGKTPHRIIALGGVYLDEPAEDKDSAIYIMQCELIYLQKARFTP